MRAWVQFCVPYGSFSLKLRKPEASWSPLKSHQKAKVTFKLSTVVVLSYLWLCKDQSFFFSLSLKDPSWAPHGYVNDKGIIWPFVYKPWRMPSSRKTIRHNWPISSENNTMHTSNRAFDGHRRVETLQKQNTVLPLFFLQTICTISFNPLPFVSMNSNKNEWFLKNMLWPHFFQFCVIHYGFCSKKVWD